MRILYVFLLVIVININNLAFAVHKTGIQYSVPIDYTKINKVQLDKESELLYQRYSNSENKDSEIVLLNKLLSNYSILSEIEENNPLYLTRLGIIFDKLGKDRLAKSNFCKSVNLNNTYAYSYYSYGNYFYERKKYRKALKQYFCAYHNGYSSNYDTVYKIGSIYEKIGDYSNSLTYYNKALNMKYTEKLALKIQELQIMLNKNNLFNDTIIKGINK